MSKEKKYVLVEKQGAVAKVVFNRPEKRNALSRDTIREILDHLSLEAHNSLVDLSPLIH